MTEATFETASLADSIKKAAAIAPSTGQAFDKAAGLVMEVHPEAGVVVLKATDMSAYYMEWITPSDISGPATRWRMPSKMVAGFIGSLPIGSGKTTTLRQEDRTLHITSGRARCRFQLIDSEYYPSWESFGEDHLSVVESFGGRLKQVAWAVSTSNEPPFTDVYMDGEMMVATDRYKVATVPLSCDIEAPISIPPTSISSILKENGDIKIGVLGTMLHIMPDDSTQLMAVISGTKYPPVWNIMRRDYPEIIETNRTQLVDCIQRSRHAIGADRSPVLKTWFGREEIAFAVLQEGALIGDVVPCEGFATHSERFEIGFGHDNLLGALNNSPNDKITLGYDPGNIKANLYIDGGSGYEAWVAPRRGTGA